MVLIAIAMVVNCDNNEKIVLVTYPNKRNPCIMFIQSAELSGDYKQKTILRLV